jgi:hypothetical protein
VRADPREVVVDERDEPVDCDPELRPVVPVTSLAVGIAEVAGFSSKGVRGLLVPAQEIFSSGPGLRP